MLPADQRQLQFTPDLRIQRLLNGLWQVSGAHGAIDPRRALPAMLALHAAGFTTWDLADHYGPAEDFIGEFRRQLAAAHGPESLAGMQAFTKWVPPPRSMTRTMVADAIALSRRRMSTDTLDLLQFHWWDYANEQYLVALDHLAELQQAGQIRHLALTNFDTRHLERILDHGIAIVSNQVQYSLIDRRPEVRLAPLCVARRVWLLTYGTLCGGLLSDRYLDQPEPGRGALTTASLRKYKQMIDAWGGWSLFQELLTTLDRIGSRKGVSIANLAVRYVLDQPAVAGVIVGARLGVSEHIADNDRVFATALEPGERDEIDAVLSKGRDLMALIGDCGDEYRR